MQDPISISGIASVSALGTTPEGIWNAYKKGTSLFTQQSFNGQDVWVAALNEKDEQKLQELQHSNASYNRLDRSVLLAFLAAKKAFLSERFTGKQVGVNIGSSRGATGLFEKFYQQYLQGEAISPVASPTTTLGNISSWVGQELMANGPVIGHSVTCSTALHAVLNGIAWLQAGMADAFVVGGSEAALTPFTMAQMQALKLYSKVEDAMACQSMHFQKKRNTMVLGEAAAVAVLEKGVSSYTQAIISGYGYGTEVLEHNSSISENAECFQKSMQMALQKANIATVDAIVMHAPGTVKGDMAEFNAIQAVFLHLPLLTSNKWLVGHTFAASGMLSIEMAVLMLQQQQFIENPFFRNGQHSEKPLKTVMVNAVGFGGNAVSIIISKP